MQGKHFSITDPDGVKTVIYQVNKTKKEYLNQYPKYTVERLDHTEEIVGNYNKKTFYIDEPQKDGNQLIILSFAKDKVVINNGILLGDEVKITKKPTPFKFNTLYSEQETEYKDFQYTPNFKRPISIIDPETTEEVKPVLYFDEKTNEVKGKCKLKPYKSYFAFEIRDEGQGGNVMTANKKQRDTQIPVEAIEGAAGKDDKGITIVAINPVVLGLLND